MLISKQVFLNENDYHDLERRANQTIIARAMAGDATVHISIVNFSATSVKKLIVALADGGWNVSTTAWSLVLS